MNKTQDNTILYGLDQVSQVAAYIRRLMPICSVITFTGPLGAGKTTIIRELLHQVGVQEPITSPTFTYMNVYTNKVGQKFYHFDLYRIDSLDAFCETGFDEYLYHPHSWALIEWPEHIMSILTHDVCHLVLDYVDNKRKISHKGG